MKVLQVGKFYYPVRGGIEQVVFDITEGLNEREIQTDVLCANTSCTSEIVDFENYKVFKSASYGTLSSTSLSPRFIYTFCKIAKNYDIIHIHHPNPLAFLALCIARPKAKIIIHWHSDIVRQKKSLKYFLPLQNWSLDFADKIIVTSPNYAKYSQHLKAYAKKTKIIPIGIEEKEFISDKKRVQTIRNKYQNKKIILAIGRLVGYKGFDVLVEAAKYMDDEFVIVIIGDGEQKSSLLKKIETENLSSKVHLVGNLTHQEKCNYLDACYTFVLPSVTKAEAFGVVLLEAMIFSKPLVSTNLQESGLSWVNKDKLTGLQVEPNSPKALATSFKKLLNGKLYTNLSKNSYARFKDLFQRDKMLNLLEELYY